MSLEINVYCSKLSDDLIPKIVKRLNEFDMVVEVHPEFSFSDQTGFLPFKFRLTNPQFNVLKNKELKCGFELYIQDFELFKAKENLKPKLSLFNKLLGKKQPEIPFASNEIETRLNDCNKVVTFIWHADDSFEFRFASLTGAILTELTNGVCTFTTDDIWYENKNIVANAYKEIKAYEKSLKEKELDFMTFDAW